jgi:hypothetical protein
MIIADPKNGMGRRVGYIGPSKGVKFSGVNVACSGTATLTVYTTNGDAVGSTGRYLQFIVNGGSPQVVSFVGAGDWSNPAGAAVTLSGFNQGANNTIYVTADNTHPAPDLDWIEITNTGAECSGQTPGCAVGKTVTIKNSANGMYASARNDTLNVISVATASTWETYDIVDAGGGMVALKSHMNYSYVTADLGISTAAPLRARSASIGAWEQYTISPVSGGYAFRANANGKYVQANLGLPTADLQARSSAVGSWETFNCQ